MRQCVALIRGINVGGKKLVGMAELRKCFADCGLHEPRTLLQSGNVVFGTTSTKPEVLATELEQRIERQFGHAVKLMIRTAAQWKDIIAQNPFTAEAGADPAHLVAMCLADRPAAMAVDALRKAIMGRERIELLDRTLYIVYPAGIGMSRLTGAIIERKLGTAGTARNWNTVLKIAAAIAQRD